MCCKLREWVGTETGKGDRWGRDKIGRSAPAFLSTTALPPPTCTMRGRTSSAAVVFAARPANCGPGVLRPVPDGASAGCVACRALFSRLCLPACHFACHAHCPSHHLPPFSLLCALPRSFLLCPCSIHVRQDRRLGPAVCQGQQFASCKTVPLAAATRACSGGPCTGPFVLTYLFPCRVHDPGPWDSVEL